MTGEFSQFEEKSVLLAHDKLKVEKPSEVEVRVEYLDNDIRKEYSDEDDQDQISNSIFSLVAGLTQV